MDKTDFSQAELLALLRPAFEKTGRPYRKKRNVLAKPAKEGEVIATVTADGLETTNTAHAGDFIIQNMTEAGERYILPEAKFTKKYALLRPSESGWNEYEPTGKIVALAFDEGLQTQFHLPDTFHFMARWGQPMVAKQGDFLASPPDYSEVYRIAQEEFYETYAPVELN